MRIKNTLLTAMAVAVLFNAVSCCESGPVTTTLETSGTYMLSEGSEAELDLKIDIEYLISGLDEEILGNINRTLTSAMFEEMPSDMSIEEAVAAYKDRKVAEYRKVNLSLLQDSTYGISPASASWSMIRAARLNPILKARCSMPIEAFSFSIINFPAWAKYSATM